MSNEQKNTGPSEKPQRKTEEDIRPVTILARPGLHVALMRSLTFRTELELGIEPELYDRIQAVADRLNQASQLQVRPEWLVHCNGWGVMQYWPAFAYYIEEYTSKAAVKGLAMWVADIEEFARWLEEEAWPGAARQFVIESRLQDDDDDDYYDEDRDDPHSAREGRFNAETEQLAEGGDDGE